jgi:hypothetical protein
MAKHKVFVCAMYSEAFVDGDTCVMMVFPKEDKRYHIIARPIMLEADSIPDLRKKMNDEINMYMSTVRGFVPQTYSSAPSAPVEPVALVEVDSLTIAPEGPAVSDPNKSQMLLDLGSL